MSLISNKMKGFSLIEIAVTAAITAVGLLGLSSLQLQSMKATQDSGSRSQAIWIGEEIKNRIQANKVGKDSYVTPQPRGCNDFADGIKMCSAYHTGRARMPADMTCTEAELAEYDLFDVLCGPNINEGGVKFKTNSADSMSDPEIFIANVTAQDLAITISWNAQASGYDDSGNRKYKLDEQIKSHRAEYRVERFRP